MVISRCSFVVFWLNVCEKQLLKFNDCINGREDKVWLITEGAWFYEKVIRCCLTIKGLTSKRLSLGSHFLMAVTSRWDFFGDLWWLRPPPVKKKPAFLFFADSGPLNAEKLNDCSKNLVRNDNFITRMLQYFVFMFVFWCHDIWKSNLLTQPKNRIYRYLLATFTLYSSSWKTNENSRHSTFSYIKKLYSQFHSDIFFKRTPIILFLGWM